jgi:hypothetical protein
MKKLIALTLIAGFTLLSPVNHLAQLFLPTIVFDPSVNASIGALNATSTANQIQQILHQIEQIKTAVDTFLKLKETYDKIKETYDLAKKMSEYLKGLDAYAMGLGQWQGPGASKDLFGVTGGIQLAMGGSLTPQLGKSYGESTNPLNAYAPEMLASMSSYEKDRIKANASTVAIADAASQQSFAAVGSVAGAMASAEPRVAALTGAALSDAPEMNTHAALLNRINVAAAYTLASQHDANKLLSVIANSQAVALKSERERYADAINIDIYLRKNLKKDWKWGFDGADTALKSFKVSDFAFK